MSVRLLDLDPRFVGAGGEGVTGADGSPVPERRGVGLSFQCPCGRSHEGRSDRVFVTFANPLDGGPALDGKRVPTWQRSGDTFETLTLSPSIQRVDPDGCGWHGFVENGMVRTC